MNAVAWQPSRTGPEKAKFGLNLPDKSQDKAAGARDISEMAVSARLPGQLRVLVSEGNSTSAREAITILGLSGHHVEICDPSPVCLARFSRFVEAFHRCPGLRDDPAGLLALIEKLLGGG